MEQMWSVLLMTLFCLSVAYEELDVGSRCSNNGSPGVCKRVMECPIAMEALKKWHKTNLKRCGFVDSDEIICCHSSNSRANPDLFITFPGYDTDETTSRVKSNEQFSKRKYQKACDEIVNQSRSNVQFNILGGENAAHKEFPHMAALGFESDESDDLDWLCGASIISNNFLLTAAHCVARAKPIKARVGVTWLNDTNPQDINIKKITMHHSYDPLSKHGDIALIELNDKITFSDKAKPACLYSQNNDPLGLIVTGWGKTSIKNEDDRSTILQKAKLVAVPLSSCNNTYSLRSLGTKTIESTQLCASANSSDACWGDSGGPLQIRESSGVYRIIGVVSYGAGCGGKIPGVYTRVSSYVDWIESIVW